MLIDLHTHSSVSDGTETPAELMATARAAGLDVVALTDHDTTAGWAAAEAARPAGLTVVPGMELSCRWFPADQPPISVHLLAYLFDPLTPAFAAERARLRDERLGRGERIVAALAADGYPVVWERDRRRVRGRGGGPSARRPGAGGRRGGRVGRRRLRHAAAPPQPVLRREGRHRRPRGHRADPRGRRRPGVRPRARHHAGAHRRGRRDRGHGRGGTARPGGRPPRPHPRAARAPRRPGRRPRPDPHRVQRLPRHQQADRDRASAPPSPAQFEALLAAGTGSAPYRD